MVGLQEQRRRDRLDVLRAFDALAKAHGIEPPQLWEGKKGSKSTAVREFNLEVRPILDELITEKATDYIKRQAKTGQAVLHVRRAVAHASARGRAPGLGPEGPESSGATPT